MAYLDATDLLDLQGSNVVNEKRFSELGILNLAKDSSQFTDYLLESQKAQMQSMSSARNLKIPVIQDQTVTVNTTPGFSFIPSNLETTAEYNFTAVDVFSGFRFYPATYDNNSVDALQAKQAKMANILYAMGSTAETLIAVELENRKTQAMSFTTQVSQGDGTFTFNTGTDVLEINKAAQKETMFYYLQELMEANELPGNYRLVTNRAGLAVQRAENFKYGAGNDKNLQNLGMLPLDRMYSSGNISAGSDIFQGWFVRDGGIGLVENFPYDFRNGTKFAGKEWSITPTALPFLNMRANVYVDTQATDATALVNDSNNTMTHFQEMAIWARFYIVYRYNSAIGSRVNDVVKITGLTT